MNLIKVIVKKILDVDDFEAEGIDDLLAKAISAVRRWK
jgi:hypothetical protein